MALRFRIAIDGRRSESKSRATLDSIVGIHLASKTLFDHLGLRIAFGVLRPKPLFEHLGLQVTFGAHSPKTFF